MNFELSLLNALMVEYSFSIHERLPPRSALTVPKAFETLFTVVPNTESTYVPPTAGGTNVSYLIGAMTPVAVDCAHSVPMERNATQSNENRVDLRENCMRVLLWFCVKVE